MKSTAQLHSKKFVSHLRGVTETKGYRCFSTFNYEAYQNEHRFPFGSLEVVNDEYLAPLQNINYDFNAQTQLILIPLVGAFDFKGLNTNGFVHSEQIQLLNAQKSSSLSISNPYSENWINYLQLRIKTAENPQKIDFNYNSKNTLQTIYTSNEIRITTGFFDSKAETVYRLKEKENGLFAITLNGAFEIENRLMENRDALCVKNSEEIDIEALTHQSIILLLELKL
ncbi:MAG: hypothetical protein ACK5NB_03160 [Flavobacteriaceae bacterium]